MNTFVKANRIQRFGWVVLAFVMTITAVYLSSHWVSLAAAQPEPQTTGNYAFITLSSSNQVAVVNTTTNALVSTIDTAASGCFFPWRAAITPDGTKVYVGCYSSNNVLVINSNTFTILQVIGSLPQADDIAFRRDGQYAFIGSRSTSQVTVVDTTSYFQLPVQTNGNTRSLAAHPFLDLIYITSGAGEILILDSVTFSLVGSIDVVGEPWDVVVSPDGQRLYAGDRWGQGLSVVDLETNSVVAVVNEGVAITGLDISPDGSTLYAGRLASGVSVIDTTTFQVTPVAVGGQAWETAVTCDGSKLYVGSTQDFVPIVDTSTLVVVNLPMPGYSARGIAICPQYVGDGVILFPKTQQKQGALGAIITYTTTLRNETGQTDSFGLALDGHTWPTELSTLSLGPLDQGDAATFVVTVTVPGGANWYDSDMVAVTATSVTSPTVYSETAVLTTEAYAPPQIGVTPDSLSSTQLVNSQVTQTLTISNGHGVTLTYDLNIFYGVATPTRQSGPQAPPTAVWPPSVNKLLSEPLPAPETAVSLTNLVTILTDPLGDGGPADVVEVRAESTGMAVTMQLLFAPGVIPQNVVGYIFLDIDQNPDTGADPVSWLGSPTQDVGIEYYVNLFNSPIPFSVYRSDGFLMGSITPTYAPGSVQFTIPLSHLGDDDGNMNVAIVLGDWAEPTEWVPDVGHGVIGSGGQYEWLVVHPPSGAVYSNSSDTITVTYDSSGLQPGIYPATIRVQSNDPVSTLIPVPVSLTVEPTASMGWVEGYVTDGRFNTPLQATITAEGQPYTITAGLDGYYKLWLEAGSYDLHISAPGYVSQQPPVTIIAQQGTTLNVALVEDVPVFGLSPEAISVSHYVGDVTDETMTLDNSGPAEMSFAIRERDTTSGLALLAPYARSAAEQAALLAEKMAGDENNEGAPTIASIPVHAFASLQGSTNLLAWTRYTDYYQEYTNSLNAIAQYTTFNLTETDTEDPAILAALLAAADVFLIPEQEGTYGSYLSTLGQTWADALQTFVNQGGTIVLLDFCNETFRLLQGAGLVDMQFSNCTSYSTLEVVNSEHPLAEDVPSTFYALDGIGTYVVNDGETVVKLPYSNDTVVLAKDVGVGHVAVIGFDYYSYNDDMARILANAVQWYSSDVPWLTTTPVTGTVPGYAALDVAVSLDATGLQPGLYTANLIIDTNDPHTPTQVLPVSMEVLPTTTMGQVTGAVSDAWTGDPLTATVQLEGVHTLTADPAYTIWAEAGTYTLTAFASGYMTETVTVVIPADGLVTQNLALVPAQPRLEGLPNSVSATAVVGHTATHSFTLANTGPLPLNFAWHEIDPTARSGKAVNDLAGKSILIDLSRGGTGQYNFLFLVQDITAAGGVVVENYSNPITADILAPHDVLWVNCCGYTQWTTTELAIISNWLQQGGALFLYGSGETNTAQLANLFGIEYQCCYYFNGYTTNILPHPTTEGISTVYVESAYNVLTHTPAAAVLVFDSSGSYPLAVAQEENGGRIVVVSAYTFYDWSINAADNRAFGLNIMNWLASPMYTEVPWVSTEPVTGTIPAYADQPFTMTFDATDLAPGVYEMMLVLEHNDPAHGPTLSIPVTLEVVEQESAVSVVADTLEQTAVPGQSASYQIVITNEGNAPDSFTIAAQSEWTSTLSAADTGLLAAGESFTLTVTVEVPATAANNSSDAATISVTSVFDPTVAQTVTLTTTALMVTYKVYLPLVIR